MNKRIILVGRTASGKTFLRKKLEERGFKCDISYTTRPQRTGEVNGVDYNFITEDEFSLRISNGAFYEHIEYNSYRYGTGLHEWNNMSLFIMETDGIKNINTKDRTTCFVIYMNPLVEVRIERLKKDRKWDYDRILERLKFDDVRFIDFKDYDLEITNSNVNI